MVPSCKPSRLAHRYMFGKGTNGRGELATAINLVAVIKQVVLMSQRSDQWCAPLRIAASQTRQTSRLSIPLSVHPCKSKSPPIRKVPSVSLPFFPYRTRTFSLFPILLFPLSIASSSSSASPDTSCRRCPAHSLEDIGDCTAFSLGAHPGSGGSIGRESW